jgi:hypothetical protein
MNFRTRARLVLLALLIAVYGCGEKSIEYYAANPKEAVEVIVQCQAKGVAMVSDKKCTNAIEGNARAVRAASLKQREARREALKQMADQAEAQSKK